MLSSYLKIASRHLQKRKSYALITIAGLAVGLTFTLLIGSYVWGELQVNRSLLAADRQYIVRSQWKQPGLGYEEVTVAPLGKLLAEQYPGLVAAYYRFDAVTASVSVGNSHFPREAIQAGDATMMTMYGFPLLAGNAQTALQAPNSIVLTEAYANKYFGRTDVLGRVLKLSNYVGSQQAFVVTGVLKNLPRNSVTYLGDMPVNLFIAFNSLQGRTADMNSWNIYNVATYIQLQSGVQATDLTKPMDRLIATYAPKEVKLNLHPYLTPLTSYYRAFNKSIVEKTIYIVSSIALLVLLMALVNFITLVVANSSVRIREIGVRKAMGGVQQQLIGQFLTESVVLVLLSLLLSIPLYEALRSPFAQVVGRPLPPIWTLSPYFTGAYLLFAIGIGLLAGSYPAFVLSALPSIEALSGKLKSIRSGQFTRRLLLTAQFTLALLVFFGTNVITQQVAYFFDKDLGFNRSSILLVSLPHDWTPQGVARITAVRDALAQTTSVKAISISSATLKGGPSYNLNIYPVEKDSTQSTATSILQTDERFLDTYQIPLVAGRFYSAATDIDYNHVMVLNESAVRALGYDTPAAAISRQLYSVGDRQPITIIGVIKDVNFGSLRDRIAPLAIGHIRGGGNLMAYFSIKLSAEHITRSVADVEANFHRLMPDEPFEYTLTDEALAQFYEAERQLERAAQTASLLSILIVFFGVLGTVSVRLSQRTKELAIRKVLGATGITIIGLFLIEFVGILAIALLISLPVASLFLGSWLENFVYHIDLDWVTFALFGFSFGLVVSLLVGLLTLRAARLNPVQSLRSEQSETSVLTGQQ